MLVARVYRINESTPIATYFFFDRKEADIFAARVRELDKRIDLVSILNVDALAWSEGLIAARHYNTHFQ